MGVWFGAYNLVVHSWQLMAKIEDVLTKSLDIIKPTQVDDNARKMAYEYVIQVIMKITKISSMQDFTITSYGSFESGLHTKTSDIDVSVNVPGSSPQVLKQIETEFFQDTTCTEVKAHWGDVPVVKMKVNVVVDETHFNINCDITVNNKKGEFNTSILKALAQRGPQIIDFVLLVKRWSTVAKLRDPYNGTFSSYAIYLLSIFFLQNHDPPLLPPLSEFVKFKITDSDSDREKVILDAVVKYIHGQREIDDDAGSLFLKFIKMFQDVLTKGSNSYISIYHGKWINYEKKQNKQQRLVIEEPFELMKMGVLKSPFARIKDKTPVNILVKSERSHLEKIARAFTNTLQDLNNDEARTGIIGKMVDPTYIPTYKKSKARSKISNIQFKATLTSGVKRVLKEYNNNDTQSRQGKVHKE
ncbi:protein HESO1 [Tanacetum coccineum]|uniref:Protein HESO1 n=1 Tax=Tanacetum coccineum TaxID=301880 RepID=A0ABQ5F401_9ASTR